MVALSADLSCPADMPGFMVMKQLTATDKKVSHSGKLEKWDTVSLDSN